jgi:ATP-binding cassette subfamily B protein
MKNPYISLLKTSWTYARNERKKFLLIYTMFICANVVFSLNPLLFGWFIGKIQNNTNKVLYYSLIYACCYIGLKLTEWSMHGPARVMERTLAFNLSRNYLQEKFHQTLHLTAKWHQDHHSGATINRIKKAYEALRDFFDRGFVYLYTLTKFVFSVGAIIFFSPLFGSIAIAIGLLNVFVISRFDKPFIKTLNKVNEREHNVTSNLFDSLSNIRTVITLRLEKSIEKGLLYKVQLIFRPFRKNSIINEWKWFTADILISIIYCVVVVGYVYQHWEPGKTFYIAGLVTLLGYVNQFTSVFQNVAGQYTDLVQYNTYTSGAANITESYERNHRADKPIDLPQRWQLIEIKNLNFSHRAFYNQQFSPQSLHNLYVQIKKGKKIALIGESGCGKSTLLSLLRGLYSPEKETEILIDGKKFDMDSLNESITLFPQEPEIFENTIAYNITLGLPFREEEILNACEKAQFIDVVEQMPHGLYTDIREKGVNLSGGQKQRLALARGILASRDSELILLDEPTSSVDARTESMIYDNLFKAFPDKAIISSIHRLHLLDQFDHIYLLDKGCIVAEGNLEQLLLKCELFRDLWKHQNANAA